MVGTAKRGILLGCALLLAVVLGYLGALLLVAPSGAQAAPATPAAPSAPGPAAPPKGLLERAVSLVEKDTGGVAVKAEAKNGNGAYEVEVLRGNEEIKMLVDTTTERVTELDREVVSLSDD